MNRKLSLVVAGVVATATCTVAGPAQATTTVDTLNKSEVTHYTEYSPEEIAAANRWHIANNHNKPTIEQLQEEVEAFTAMSVSEQDAVANQSFYNFMKMYQSNDATALNQRVYFPWWAVFCAITAAGQLVDSTITKRNIMFKLATIAISCATGGAAGGSVIRSFAKWLWSKRGFISRRVMVFSTTIGIMIRDSSRPAH